MNLDKRHLRETITNQEKVNVLEAIQEENFIIKDISLRKRSSLQIYAPKSWEGSKILLVRVENA